MLLGRILGLLGGKQIKATTCAPGPERTASGHDEGLEGHLGRVHQALIICAQHPQYGLHCWDGETVRSILLSIKSFGSSVRPLVTHLVAPRLAGVDALRNLQDLKLDTNGLEGFGGLPRLRAHDLWPLAGLTAITRLCLANTMVYNIQVLTGLKALRVLSLSKCKEVAALSPLHGLSLQHLDLSSTSVADITPLAHMSSLEVLRLVECPLRTLTPHLPGLQELDLEGTRITDIAPLSAMSELRILSLWGLRNVHDFAPIAALLNLHTLVLSYTSIANEADPAVLSGLSHLRVLKLAHTLLSDLGPLQLLQLEELDISATTVVSLDPLADMHCLRCLDVRMCRHLQDASAMRQWTGLEALRADTHYSEAVFDMIPDLRLTVTKLDLSGVEDVSAIALLQNLHTLILAGSPVHSIRPLSHLTSLKWLMLRGSPVADLRPLQGLPLERLNCSMTRVNNLTPLARITTLAELVCSGCPRLVDTSPLARLRRLRWLSLSNTSVNNLWPLSQLPLEHLFLDYTLAHDLSAVATVHTLVCLDVSGTPVRDLSPLVGLTGLKLLGTKGCPAVGMPPAGMVQLQDLAHGLDIYTPYPAFESDTPGWLRNLDSGDWLHRRLLSRRDWKSVQ